MKKVLVVEDDDALNEQLCQFLRNSGYSVSNAFNGEDGLRIFHKTNPDFVVLDIFMPGMDGLEVLIEMRRENPHAKIILISGQQHLMSRHNLKMAEQLGADATLSKPFSGQQLLAHLHDLSRYIPVS